MDRGQCRRDRQDRPLGPPPDAYSIKGVREGLYAVLTFKADPKILVPIERNLKLAEDIVRYLVINLDD